MGRYPWAVRAGGPLLGGGGGALTNDPVNFGGGATPPVLNRGGLFTGMADGKVFSFSFWLRPTAIISSRFFVSDNQSIAIRTEATGRIRFLFNQVGGGLVLDARTSAATPVLLNQWTNIHGYIDLTNEAASDIEVNGVPGISTSTFTDAVIDFVTTPLDYLLGARVTIGADAYEGDVADFWFDQSFVDDNSLFFSPERTPVDPLPPGLVRLTGALADWPTNKGTGGGMTSNGDALTLGQSPIEAP